MYQHEKDVNFTHETEQSQECYYFPLPSQEEEQQQEEEHNCYVEKNLISLSKNGDDHCHQKM